MKRLDYAKAAWLRRPKDPSLPVNTDVTDVLKTDREKGRDRQAAKRREQRKAEREREEWAAKHTPVKYRRIDPHSDEGKAIAERLSRKSRE